MSPRFLSLKDAVDAFEVEASDGARLAVYEAGGARSAPALLVGHANGLAAGSYGPWLRDLARDFRVFAFDARGHGGSTWPEGPLETVFSVDRFADDLAEIVAALRARLGADALLHYAGHSLAAAAAVRLAARGIELPLERVTLFEPPIFPPQDAPKLPRGDRAAGEADPRRRAAAGAVGESRKRSSTICAPAASSAASCRRCWRRIAGRRSGRIPPEAVSFVARPPSKVRSLPSIATPTPGSACRAFASGSTVSGDASAPDRDWVSGAMAGIVARIPGADRVELPGTGHMMIFQQPDACRELLLRTV